MSASTSVDPVIIPEPEQDAGSASTAPPPYTEEASGDDGEEIDSETDDAEGMLRLRHIPTLAQMYKEGLLKPVTEKHKVKRTFVAGLLDRVSLIPRGDITKLHVDAIVNAANKSLLGGGGVDGAIHHAAGPKLVAECRHLNGCLTGQSKITRGYDLPAAHVIHTVGPIYSEIEKEIKAKQLESCYKTSLQLAVENSLRHIAFPCISTGIYGYPIEDATRIALQTVRDFVDSEEGSKLERVVFVIFTPRDRAAYEEILPEYFPPAEESA